MILTLFTLEMYMRVHGGGVTPSCHPVGFFVGVRCP